MANSLKNKSNSRYIGEAIKYFRSRTPYTQEALSEKVRASRTYIGMLESGARRPSLEMLLKIATALGIAAGDLLNDMQRRMLEERNKS